MRAIKFRAWHKKEQKMYLFTFGDLIGWDDGTVWLKEVFDDDRTRDDRWPIADGSGWVSPDLELMQYTGLKDAHGTEIYEGDIILVADTKWTVAWHRHENDMLGWMVKDSKIHHWYVLDKSILRGEVVGNIYEVSKRA